MQTPRSAKEPSLSLSRSVMPSFEATTDADTPATIMGIIPWTVQNTASFNSQIYNALENPKFASLQQGEQIAWLRTVTRNKIIDWYRLVNRYQTIELTEITDQLFDDDYLAPEQVAMRSEEYTKLHAALERLSSLQRQVVRLRFFAGLRSTEIATALGKNEGTVRVLLSRALNLLRRVYEEQ